jgi:hypothetical protein
MNPTIKRIRSQFARLSAPTASNLPSWLTFLWLPALLLFAVAILTIFGISGSSTGYFWNSFGTGTDPNLLWGTPRNIRGDEWWVQASWVVSQYQQNFPTLNRSFPGGISALLYNDLPAWHWSMLFRPHAGAMLFLPLAQGMALRWWLPLAVTIAAVYVFCVTLLPRRPFASAGLAIATGFSPMIMWWALPSNIWPIAWGFAVLGALAISLKARATVTRLIPAGIAGYLAVTMSMSLYAPYIVAVYVPALFLALGMFFSPFSSTATVRHRLKSIVPLAVGQLGAVAITATWLYKNKAAVAAMLSTVYPGNRTTPTGAADPSKLADLFSSPFQMALLTQPTLFGVNQSEASAPLALSLFLCVPLSWLAWMQWRKLRRIDWLAVSLVVGNAIIMLWMFVPGWDFVARLLLLDRTTTPRVWYSFIVLTTVAVVVLALRLDELKVRAPWRVVALSVVSFCLVTLIPLTYLLGYNGDPLNAATAWPVILIAEAIAITAVQRGHLATTVGAFLITSLALGAGVNPVYVGVFNLNDTAAGRSVAAINAANPQARWVNVGGFLPLTMLFESGATVYGGVQTYPSPVMWRQIDPSGRYENNWNRLAHVRWKSGQGEPQVSNDRADKIVVTFDSCAAFAQKYVTNVLSDKRLSQACLDDEQVVTQGPTTLYLYAVKAAATK